jgi:hypothetical protein
MHYCRTELFRHIGYGHGLRRLVRLFFVNAPP